MEKVKLFEWQEEALKRMKNGCILKGGVGTGKSLTALAYYYILNGGHINTQKYVKMNHPCDLYIITTARKRDTFEWESELIKFRMTPDKETSIYNHKIVIDSWNNIQKYVNVKKAFFIFDEQRVVGYGAWSKSFIRITRQNKWILLTATPGDSWMDYIPVFIANGFFENKTEFCRKHVVFSSFTKYQKVERYINEGILLRYRKMILVDMEGIKKTIPHHSYIYTDYDRSDYKEIEKSRWNIFKDKPIENASEYCLCLRRVVNSSIDRKLKLLDILKEHPKIILFYSYNYELEILKSVLKGYPYSEWNGHKHESIPVGDEWVYLVEYIAGAEGWNCTSTDTMVFYSQNYSYKIMEQASGRINRVNTPYTDLYYYHFLSQSPIDKAIFNALRRKKKFNETSFVPKPILEDKN